MKLGKILKKRKAMTPLMIGIIVAASVIAVIFIILAATVPIMSKEVHMGAVPTSIRGNSTNGEKLIFYVVCDYDDGILIKVGIEKNGVLYGEANVNFAFEKSEQRNIEIDLFDATSAAQTAGEYNVTNNALVLQQSEQYTLILTFTNLDNIVQPTSAFDFTFKLPD